MIYIFGTMIERCYVKTINMDKEIPKEVRRKEALRLYMKIAGGVIAGAAIVAGVMFAIGKSVKESDLHIAAADRGTLESSVPATGKIVPLHEQTIVSPVATRLLEIYCSEGDNVEVGESLLRLDLHSAESDLRRMHDEASMKNNEIEQVAIANDTYLTDLEMKIKVKEMSVSHLKAEVANERRLDSIGSGTGDRIREAELAYSAARLELEQMKTQLKNEKTARAAALRSKQLEGSISSRNLKEMERTLDDARVKAPMKGSVTFLNKSIGSSIGAGEKLAVVSDLGHFKINAEIAEGNSGKLSVGAPVKVRINRKEIRGRISNISPQSSGGVAEFTVVLDNDSDPLLRSGLRTELNVIYDVRDDVVRIPNGAYFQGQGSYMLFVKTAEGTLERRSVNLGESNFDFVEVVSGISPGEKVVVTDMSDYKNNKRLKLKQ